MPEFTVEMHDGKVSDIAVNRGAPCGATWQAARRIVGLAPAEAMVRMGLEVQFLCAADPSAWDPITGHSPVHFAGEFHIAAARRALARWIRGAAG